VRQSKHFVEAYEGVEFEFQASVTSALIAVRGWKHPGFFTFIGKAPLLSA